MIAQTALKSAFVLGTNEEGVGMANESYQYNKIYDVVLILVGQIVTMIDQRYIGVHRRDFSDSCCVSAKGP